MSQRVGNYDVLDKIGQGGMGAVFMARQRSMDRIVALKILPPLLARNEEYVKRFLREAHSAGAISHPHLINAIECGKVDNYYFISMEYVPGANLRHLVDQEGPRLEGQVLVWLRQIASALQAAHDKGIVHRDVKPENIILTEDGQAKLGDLGLAKAMSGEADLTLGGVTVGTPHYLAPEQARGDDCDGRSDIYALGSTAYFLLTGRTLFNGPSAAAIAVKHVTDPAPALRDTNASCSPGIERIIDRCLQKNPERRYQSCYQLIADLERLERGEQPLGTPRLRRSTTSNRALTDRQRRYRRRSNLPLLITAGALLLLVIAVAAMQIDQVTPAPHHTATAPDSRTLRPTDGEADTELPSPAPLVAANSIADHLTDLRRRLANGSIDHAAAIDHLDRLAENSGDDVALQAIRATRQEFAAAWTKRCQTAWQAVSEPVEAALSAADFDRARRLLPEAGDAWDERLPGVLKRLASQVDSAGRAAVEKPLQEARRAIAEQRLDLATTALQRTRAVQDRQALAAVADELDRLDRKLQALRIHLHESAAETHWRECLPGIFSALQKGKATAACRQAHQASTRFPALQQTCQAVTRVAAALTSREQAPLRHLRQQLDQTIHIERQQLDPIDGRLVEATPTEIRLHRVAVDEHGNHVGEGIVPVPWTQVSETQRAHWRVQCWQADEDDHHRLAEAIASLADKRLEDCAAQLAELSGEHPLAAYTRQALAEARLVQRRATATAAWDALTTVDLDTLDLAGLQGQQAALTAFARDYPAESDTERIADQQRAIDRRLGPDPAEGLLAWYPFDGEPGQALRPHGGTGPHLQRPRKDARPLRRDEGVDGHAWPLDRTCLLNHRGILQQLANEAQWTICFWYRPNDNAAQTWLLYSPGWQPAISLFHDRRRPGEARLSGNLERGRGQNRRSMAAQHPVDLLVDHWYHIGLVFDGEQPASERLALYLDGEAVARGGGPFNRSARPQSLCIGHPNTRHPSGSIDNLRLYQRAFDAISFRRLIAEER